MDELLTALGLRNLVQQQSLAFKLILCLSQVLSAIILFLPGLFFQVYYDENKLLL